MQKWNSTLAAVLSLLPYLVVGSLFAEEPKRSTSAATSRATFVLIPGSITGIETYGPLGYWRLCAPRAVGLIEWHVGFIERLLKPTEAQRSSLNGLVVASADAKEAISSACPKETIETTTVQLAVMERRVAGLLNALKIIRPAYESFYSSLDNHQKALLDKLGPGRRGWRW